jgi:hypothetical protein
MDDKKRDQPQEEMTEQELDALEERIRTAIKGGAEADADSTEGRTGTGGSW